ncbi:Kinetochore Sim4 complex subunit Fta4 protein [Rutstroemia sp. NJR-2017a WRK4]|nr:Kinetochore Sim4 complex subunit Fta4 protein [Rutstroemia sp. NJR-2017a WRK4]
MNSYQNFGDPNQSGQPSNSRQPPPSPGQNMAHANGMNGQMSMAGMAGMIGFPTPAGHQSDLNYIMQMVEELSRLLANNQKITDGILEKIGNVRQRAKDQNLSNEELLALVSEELNNTSNNLEKEVSTLSKALQFSKSDAEDNWKLVLHAASILEDLKEKTHAYRYQHEKDTLAWHASYREQLAAERKENLELRCHIADMQAHAAKANEYLNQMRRYASEHRIIGELEMRVQRYREERNFWKRMACPGLGDEEGEFSEGEDGGEVSEGERRRLEGAIRKREEMGRILGSAPGES